MLAEESLHEGNLEESLAQLQQQVREHPADSKYRVFLFQLLVVMGEWERAMTQLNVIGEMDAGALAMVQMYREALRCETLRADVFAGRRSPLVFGEPEQWLAELIEAFRLSADGHHGQARELREQAFDAAPAVSGTLDGVGFQWIADGDSRLGPVLEAIVNGRYYWVPFSHIRSIKVEEPEDLRDLVWVPAYFTWANEGESVGLIPTRYAGSENSDNGQILLSRRTEWIELDEGTYQGLGQRLLVTDVDEYPLLNVREILLDTETQ